MRGSNSQTEALPDFGSEDLLSILFGMTAVNFGAAHLGAGRDDWQFSSTSATRVISAATPDQVLPLLHCVEAATASGAYAVLMMSYEAAGVFDHALATHQTDDFPLAWAAIFTEPQTRLQPTTAGYGTTPWQPLIDRSQYESSIAQVRDFIAQGHTYQVNYSFPLVCGFQGDPLAWYTDLCQAQRAPFSVYLDVGSFQVLCFSPELFFSRQADRVITKPMKGTIARGRWLEEDEELAQRLRHSQKERAENVMIVDLLRNDLGKVSEPGSVQVTNIYEAERYETLWQMTSTVEATLKPGTGLVQLLTALFPCGSITGAPKVRTMEIIRQLERFPRRVFTGTIGLIRPGGDCCFNVAIRTVLLNAATGQATFGVGGGITYDSVANAEYEECLLKSSFLTQPVNEFQLLESLLLKDGELPLLERHLRRLRSSSKFFGFTLRCNDVVAALAKTALTNEKGSWKVRLTLSRDGSFEIDVHPVAPESGLRRVRFDSGPVNASDKFLFHKTTNRVRYEQALAQNPDCDDVLLWNERGEVTESTIANVVVPIDGKFYTPPRQAGLLDGTFRAELLGRGTIHERSILKTELPAGRHFYLINSVRKWMPAVLVG